MRRKRGMLERGMALWGIAFVVAGCEAVATVGVESGASALGTATAAQVIPSATGSTTAVVPPASQVEEPLAPLLAGASATLAGRRISIGEILGSPQDFVNMGVQILGGYVAVSAEEAGEVPKDERATVWGIRDSSGEILVTGLRPSLSDMGEVPGAQVVVVGEVMRMADGTPYLAAQAAEVLTGLGGSFDASQLMEAEALADQLAGKGIDVRLAQVYIGTAQWLNLAERPGEANRYLDLAMEMLENPERFERLAGQLPPRTPVHAFPTPPGTFIPQPEGGDREK